MGNTSAISEIVAKAGFGSLNKLGDKYKVAESCDRRDSSLRFDGKPIQSTPNLKFKGDCGRTWFRRVS